MLENVDYWIPPNLTESSKESGVEPRIFIDKFSVNIFEKKIMQRWKVAGFTHNEQIIIRSNGQVVTALTQQQQQQQQQQPNE